MQAEVGDVDEPEEGVVEEGEEDDEDTYFVCVCVWCIALFEQLPYCSCEQMMWHFVLW